MSDMTEDELVEKMARAIHDANRESYGEWHDDRTLTQSLYREEARAALSALRAAGYVPVPVEATEEMLTAALVANGGKAEDMAHKSERQKQAERRIYAAMVFASPLAKKEGGG